MRWFKASATKYRTLLHTESRVLLVTAHPDDEVMFFTPLLSTLKNNGCSVSILCLSDGNAEGLGNIRASELLKCAAMFQINSKNVHIIHSNQLVDGMTTVWPTDVVAEFVIKHIISSQPSVVGTFVLLRCVSNEYLLTLLAV
jgi:N-acetylglucosaminylphosphatidylinositol deacetylase